METKSLLSELGVDDFKENKLNLFYIYKLCFTYSKMLKNLRKAYNCFLKPPGRPRKSLQPSCGFFKAIKNRKRVEANLSKF